MKITKTRLKQIIKEELEAVIESEQGEIDAILYLILDRELPSGSTAEQYLKDAISDRGQTRVLVRDYIKNYGKNKLISAIKQEIESNPDLY